MRSPGPFLLRWAGFFGLWVVIAAPGLGALAVGAGAATLATVLSLRLLPPSGSRLAPLGLLRLVLHIAWQSVPAGIDVARRALSPRMGLRPGMLAIPTALPPGHGRAAFRAVASLLPGSVAVGREDAASILVHGLDLRQDLAAQSLATEALFQGAIAGRRDG